MKDFGEICERRNIITHASGIVNRRYRERLIQLKFPEKDIPKIGEELDITSNYILRSNGRVALLGFWILHSVWRKISPSESVESMRYIISASHDMLTAGFTKMARRICTLGLSFDKITDVEKAYLVINLALSYYLEDGVEEVSKKENVEKSLSLREWDIVNGKFALAICCLKEDYENLGEKIDGAVADGVDIHDFMNWALFKKIRGLREFNEKMISHFNVDLREARDAT